MRVLFAGTPEIAVSSLRQLASRNFVAGVLTNPDKPKGRGKKLAPSPVKAAALELGIPVFTPDKLDQEFREEVKKENFDLLVVFAYGKIFRKEFLDLFPLGGINLHPSKLPKYRGPSPLNAAILAGEKDLSISVQTLSLEMDAGDILLQEDHPLRGTETALDLMNLTSELAPEALERVVENFTELKEKAVPQNPEEATYCGMIQKAQGIIDWSDRAVNIHRKIRAYYPWPKAFTYLKDAILYILEAQIVEGSTGDIIPGKVVGVDKNKGILIQTGDGLLAVSHLQLQSKKALDYKSFLNGVSHMISAVLGSTHGTT